MKASNKIVPMVIFLGMTLAVSSCTLFAPAEENKVRTALDESGIQYERLHRSFKGDKQYSYRLTLKDGYSPAQGALTAMEAWHPESDKSSLEITNVNYDTVITFFGGGEEDIAETRKLSAFFTANKDHISRLHYKEPREEAPVGSKLRLVVEYSGEVNVETIKNHIRTASSLTGGTILSFNENKITLIGEPDQYEIDALSDSLTSIYKTIEQVSPDAEEYDYKINANTSTKEIIVTKSISDEATIDKNTILAIALPEGWRVSL